MKKSRCYLRRFLLLLATILPVVNARAETTAAVNMLANASFERPPLPEDGNEPLGVPESWNGYQWGATGSAYNSVREAGAGRDGGIALRAENLDSSAQAGIFTKMTLGAGAYELSVWARVSKGRTAKIRLHLAGAYSRVFAVTDEWKQYHLKNVLAGPVENAEINLQNFSGEPSVVWFDTPSLRLVSGVRYRQVADTRAQRPRTLMFSPMNVNYLKDTAPDWAKRGFRGFLFDKIMRDWPDDVWATDGDSKTRGGDDKLLQEVAAANKACRAVGIDSNFVKVAFFTDFPDPFDDGGWKNVAEKLSQGARFARLSGCAGIALDTEYIAHQYDPEWAGFKKNPRPLPELKAKIRERWRAVTSAMLREFPEMPLLVVFEGIHYYGELYQDMFNGILTPLAEANAPGGLHVLTEGSYHLTDAGSLANYAAALQEETQDALSPALINYWKRKCTLALGAWPLGYYREVLDASGKSLGYSGRKELFGDKIVGSYADKGPWYSQEAFAGQMSGLNSFSPRYNWIYAHGDVFVQWTEAQKEHYEKLIHPSAFSVLLPVEPNLNAYFEAIAHPKLLRAESVAP